jgi:XTP/dITP diphosphohydrolase
MLALHNKLSNMEIERLKEIIFVSSNSGKLKEVRSFFEPVLNIVPILEKTASLGLDFRDVEETADSYLENARLKSRAGFLATGMPSLGDDSGLEVYALDMQPGVLTARYAGENAKSEDNINKLLAALKTVKDRRARFVCTLVLTISENIEITVTETIEGEIAENARGGFGFGYDPIFVLPEHQKTLAELRGVAIFETHRTRALKALSSKFFKL